MGPNIVIFFLVDSRKKEEEEEKKLPFFQPLCVIIISQEGKRGIYKREKKIK